MTAPALSISSIAQLSRRRHGPSELDLKAWAARDAAPLTTRCLHRPWTHSGPAGEARLHAAEHRKSEHGWKPKRRRKR